MEKEVKILTYAKVIQLITATTAILIGFAVNLLNFDSSLFFYVFFLLSAAYAIFVLKHEGLKRFAAKNRLLISLMVMMFAGILINYQYSTIYSIIRLMEVFIFLFCSMLYTGKEDDRIIEKWIHILFLFIISVTFFMTLGSLILGAFSPQFIQNGMNHFFSNDAETMLKWNKDLKQMTLGGLYHNGNQLGLNAYCSGMLSLYLTTKEKNKVYWFNVINAIIQAVGIAVSGCRSIMIAVAVTIMILAFLTNSKRLKKISWSVIVLVFLGLLAVTITKMGLNYRLGDGEITQLLNRLTGSRYSIWKECWKYIKLHPVFGVGLGNIRNVAKNFNNSFIINSNYNNAHNTIVNIVIHTGIIGSVLFLLLGRTMLHGSKRMHPILQAFCYGMLAADCFDIFLIFTDKLPTLLLPIITGYGIQKQLKEPLPIYFFSNLVEEDLYKEIYTKKERPGQQSQKFNRLIAEGFQLNGRRVVACSSVLASNSIVDYRFRKFKNHDMYHYSLSINIPVIKTLWNILGAFFYIMFAEYGECAVDVLSIDNAIGALLASNLRGMPSTGIVTDLPEHFSGDGLYAKIVYRIMNWCSSYVFLTTFMNDKLNPKGKPWIVMEGLCDINVERSKTAEREKSIIFAGEIDEQNGVLTLAEAFNQWGNQEYDLYYYGSGEAEEKLTDLVKENDHVHLMGVILNRDLLKIMGKASLLVNPRPTNQDFVKYSFPSKVMEYMNTGTYHASSRLVCIPDEYFNYIGDLGDGSADDILRFLKQFEKMPKEYIEMQAEQAQQFVLNNKNNKVQAGRIAELLDSLCN